MEAKQVPELNDFKKGVQRIKPITLSASGALTLDLQGGTVGVFNVSVNSGVNITGIGIINAPSVAPVAPETLSKEISFVLYITRTGTLGTFSWGATETWRPTSINFPLSGTAGDTDSFVIQSLDGGGSYFVYPGAVAYD
jgi:hypothetical protein